MDKSSVDLLTVYTVLLYQPTTTVLFILISSYLTVQYGNKISFLFTPCRDIFAIG